MPRNKSDDTDPVVLLVHRGPEPVSEEIVNLFYTDDPGEQDPVEDTYEIREVS